MAESVRVTCEQCGKSIYKAPSHAKRKKHHFCSINCHNEWQTGRALPEAHRLKLMGRKPWNKGRPWSKVMRAKLSRLASNGNRAMEKNGHWRGGRSINEGGYIEIRVDGKRKLEHRHVMELHLGRPLKPNELVHHENGDRTDNRIENLRLHTASTHMKHHNPHGPKRQIVKRTCVVCRATFMGTKLQKLCSPSCRKERQRQYWRAYHARQKAKCAATSAACRSHRSPE